MTTIPPPGTFSWAEGSDRQLLEDAYAAVTAAEAWDFLRDWSPPKERGFMFTQHPTLDSIQKQMKLMGAHSGASYGYCMRVMEAIAKRGWESYAASAGR